MQSSSRALFLAALASCALVCACSKVGVSDLGAPGDAAMSNVGLDGGSDASASSGPLTGALVGGTGPTPGAIAGVHFRTATQSGYTDAAGAFRYAAGETVTFSVADVDFRPTPGAPMVSPWQLVSAGTCGPSDELTNLLVLLYSLDTDGDPTNGTQIDAAAQGATQRGFSTLVTADRVALVQQLGGNGAIPDGGAGPLVDDQTAIIEFIGQMDGEAWQQIGVDSFTGVNALERSQGVATDGTDWFFSWQGGFQKTDTSYAVLEHNDLAIPAILALQGIDHIGDCDYTAGNLYCGVEDSGHYAHPTIAKFDADFNFVTSFPVPTTELVSGCPWVAVDAPSGHLIVADYAVGTMLYVHDIATGNHLFDIPLSHPITSIQGAKMFEGALYASAHDAHSGVYKIDPATGVAITLWTFDFTAEEEGCAFFSRPDGSQLHTLDIPTGAAGVELRHHQRTREPLRKSVCP